MFDREKLRFQKIFGSKNFWVRKNLGSEKILGPKKFWGQKNCGSKNIWVCKKILFKIFGPPFLRHRVKYGGLDK